jgi:hypothetical protein
LELETILYYLRFETSLFVASYDSQGHGGGIRPRLHTGVFYDELTAYFSLTRHGPHRKRRLQQFIVVAGTCLTETLPSNDRRIHRHTDFP